MNFTLTARVRRQLWRIWPLLLLAATVGAGSFALGRRFVQFYPGHISPDGSRMIAYKGIQTSRYSRIWSYITDVESGRVLCDLSKFDSIIPRWRWLPDGKSVVGAIRTNHPDREAIVQIDVTGPPQVTREYEVEKGLVHVTAIPDGSIVHVVEVKNHDSATRPYLKLISEGDGEIARFEFGRDEWVFMAGYPGQRPVIGVIFGSRQPDDGSDGDYLMTTGPNKKNYTLLQFDSRSGKEIRTVQLSPRQDGRVFETDRYAITDVDGKSKIVDLHADGEMIRTAIPFHTPLFVDDEIVVTVDRTKMYVYDRASSDSTPPRIFGHVESAVAEKSGWIMVSTYDGKLLRYDPKTGNSVPLWDALKWTGLARNFAIAGILVFPFSWLRMAARYSSLPTFAECLVLVTVFFTAVLVWCWLSIPACAMRQQVVALIIYITAATALPLTVAWNTKLRAVTAYLPPLGALLMMSGLFAVLVYAGGGPSTEVAANFDPRPLAEFVIALTLLLLFYFGGFAVLRTMNSAISLTDTSAMLKFNIRKLIAITAAFAVMFTCLRFTGSSAEQIAQQFFWLVTVTAANSIVVLAAMLCATRIRYTALAILAWAGVATVVGAVHYTVAMEAGVSNHEPERMMWYAIGLLSGVWTLILFRYVRKMDRGTFGYEQMGVGSQRSLAPIINTQGNG